MEKHVEKQMGCMAGFLQIFDRQQIITGKRLYATKRLPLSTGVDSTPEPEKSIGSPAMPRELEKPEQTRSMPSPDRFKQSPVTELSSPAAPQSLLSVEIQSKSPPLLPVLELKQGTKSSWKFCKEAPRLSLDSRATFDAKGSLKPREIRTNAAILSVNRCNEERTDDDDKQRRSPSVIARLMGLESLQDSSPDPSEHVNKPELRRSASESRASRDLFQYRFIDGVNFQLKQTLHQNTQTSVSRNRGKNLNPNGRAVDPKAYNAVGNLRAEPARAQNKGVGQRKSFFDSADFFPEPKQTISICGEIEKRLKMRGIDEPSKDLETLKHILEALQLKGLLHSKKPGNQTNQRNFVYEETPVVLIKPVKSPASMNRPDGRIISNSPPSSFRQRPGVRRDPYYSAETLPGMSPRREGPEIERNVRGQVRGKNTNSPMANENGGRSPNRRRPMSVETQRRASNDSLEQRRESPVQSPKISSKTTNRSPRRKPTVEIYHKDDKVAVPAEDELSTVSESSLSTSSHADIELQRLKLEDYNEGRNLLERCDKLLHSIAEITANELQPSPVSVLDSSFYKEESSPSPVMKRCVDFKELEDDMWSTAISNAESNSDDWDFIYISDILRASNYLPEDSDIFQFLERQRHLKGKDTSQVSALQRKLVFDTITEILNRKRHLPPWKGGQISLQQVWSEFQRIRERDASDDLVEVICGMLRKDLAGDTITGWGDCPIEMSEAVLDIERLIFKDLIGETIRDLAAFCRKGKCNQVVPVPRRKLLF
ncbi:protein LONGIFOLIA 2 isoform X1 [Populus alba]|nr:protein LONGIFOLIA 1-like isoform X1 [Populus alba]